MVLWMPHGFGDGLFICWSASRFGSLLVGQSVGKSTN